MIKVELTNNELHDIVDATLASRVDFQARGHQREADRLEKLFYKLVKISIKKQRLDKK